MLEHVQLSSYYQYFYQYSVYNRSMLISNFTHDKQGIKLNTQFTRNDHVDIIQAYNKAYIQISYRNSSYFITDVIFSFLLL